jgi:hypothetical protein
VSPGHLFERPIGQDALICMTGEFGSHFGWFRPGRDAAANDECRRQSWLSLGARADAIGWWASSPKQQVQHSRAAPARNGDLATMVAGPWPTRRRDLIGLGWNGCWRLWLPFGCG